MTSNDQANYSGIELGMLLETAREMKGWTTSDAAMRIGVGENHISAMEQGDYSEFGHELDMLAVKLKIYARKLDMSNDKINSLISSTMSQLGGK